MFYNNLFLLLATVISMNAFFNGKDPFMVHFDEFDDIISQMKSLKKELKTLEENWAENYTKEHKNHPLIHCEDHTQNVTIHIKNIPLMLDQKEIAVNATVSYNKDDHANSIHLAVGSYKITIQYHEDDHYISMSTTHASTTKQEAEDAKSTGSFHYSSKKGQTISGTLDIEAATIEADHAKNTLIINIPKTAIKSKHKKIEVTKVQ